MSLKKIHDDQPEGFEFSNENLKKAEERAHILIGIAAAVENIDEVIKIIKNSKDTENAKKNLLSKKWKIKKSVNLMSLIEKKKNTSGYQLSKNQVEAILELKLQKLTAYGIGEIEEEIKKLSKLIVEFNKIINSKKILYKLIIDELEKIKDKFSSPRKTKIIDAVLNYNIEETIQKESVKQRIEREGEGISFTEFSYMLLQSLDFAELYKRFNCTIQVGGSDQWGNITGGIDLTRRMHQKQVFGVTTPLVTKADGTKFGKTEKGTIWISAKKTSPYALYQFWLNVSDLDVYKYLRYFTFLSAKEIREIELADKSSESKPEAQGILASEVTKLLHGAEGLTAAKRISDGLFSGDISKLTRGDLEQLDLDGLPKTSFVEERVDIVQALVRCELAKSNKMAREFIGNNAISLNGSSIGSTDLILDSNNALDGGYFVLRRGKKMFHLVKLK